MLLFVAFLGGLHQCLLSVMLCMVLVVFGIFMTTFFPGPLGLLSMVLCLILVVLIVCHLPRILIGVFIVLFMFMIFMLLVQVLEDGLPTHVPVVLHEVQTRRRF